MTGAFTCHLSICLSARPSVQQALTEPEDFESCLTFSISQLLVYYLIELSFFCSSYIVKQHTGLGQPAGCCTWLAYQSVKHFSDGPSKFYGPLTSALFLLALILFLLHILVNSLSIFMKFTQLVTKRSMAMHTNFGTNRSETKPTVYMQKLSNKHIIIG